MLLKMFSSTDSHRKIYPVDDPMFAMTIGERALRNDPKWDGYVIMDDGDVLHYEVRDEEGEW